MTRTDDHLFWRIAMFLGNPVWRTAAFALLVAAVAVLFLSTCTGKPAMAQEAPAVAVEPPAPRPDPEAVVPQPGPAKGRSFKITLKPLNCTSNSMEMQSYLTHKEGETRLAVGTYGNNEDSVLTMEIWVNKNTLSWSIILVNLDTGSACFLAPGLNFKPSPGQPVTISPSGFVEERDG